MVLIIMPDVNDTKTIIMQSNNKKYNNNLKRIPYNPNEKIKTKYQYLVLSDFTSLTEFVLNKFFNYVNN